MNLVSDLYVILISIIFITVTSNKYSRLVQVMKYDKSPVQLNFKINLPFPSAPLEASP